MHFKSFRLGIGVGIILASAVVFAGTVFLVPKEEIASPPVAQVEYTDEEIIERARKLGMILIKELPLSSVIAQENEISDEEIIKRAEAMGYYLVSDIEAQQEIDPQSQTDTIENQENAENNESGASENENKTAGEYDDTSAQSQAYESTDGVVIVRIVSGENSLEIARKLFDNGVVDDARAFNNYVTINSKTRRLVTGEYKFGLNMDYEQVLNMLTRNKNP